MNTGNMEKGSYDHGLGEAWVALAEAKLAEGVRRTSIHAPVPETSGWF